jgi:hypothetical protein
MNPYRQEAFKLKEQSDYVRRYTLFPKSIYIEQNISVRAVGFCVNPARKTLYSVEFPSYLFMALQQFVGPWPLFQFFDLFYTDGRTPWTGDQSIARPLPAHRTA